MVVEGVKTTQAAYELSRKHAVEMPITLQMYKVLFAGLKPEAAVATLMGRAGTGELAELTEMQRLWEGI